MTAKQKQIDLYRAGNLETAELILADIHCYGGEESVMVRCARLVAANSAPTACVREAA
jgi:hypothetical protein